MNERKIQVEELQLQLGKREEELAQSMMKIDEEGAGICKLFRIKIDVSAYFVAGLQLPLLSVRISTHKKLTLPSSSFFGCDCKKHCALNGDIINI